MQGRESTMPPADLWESFFDAAAIVDALSGGLLDGDVVEFGCGYGTFTMPVAMRTTGTVYALDIDPRMAATTAARVAHAGVTNVIVEQRDFVADGSGRHAGSASFAMLFNILHIEDPVGLLREAHRVLRPAGRLGVTHWNHDARTPRGPSLDIRPRPDQCQAWGDEAGFSLAWHGDLPGSPWHWGMVLQKT
jgi:SAM-dependent methyltransferase